MYSYVDISDWLASTHDFWLIEKLWRDWSPGLSDERREPALAAVKQTFSQRRTLKAALGYYREAIGVS